MKLLSNVLMLTFVFVSFLGTQNSTAQCDGWDKLPNKDEAETAHVLYRQEAKSENYDAAYEQWKKAYDLSPAADGKRPFHYTDGRKILKHKLKNEKDEAKKKELIASILRLYDEQIVCYKEEAYLLGRKAYDMFYDFRTPYSKVLETLEKSVKLAGNDSEYIILDPYAHVAVYQFTNEKMTKEETRDIYNKLNEIADHNIANNEKFKTQFEAAKKSFTAVFAPVENHIFDCEYWKVKMKPEYDAAPDNMDVVKKVFAKLKQQECDPNADPFMKELSGKWEAYAAGENAKRQAEFEANNPALLASKAYKAGNYAEAITKYKEAITGEGDPSKQAGYYFSIASIEFRKLNQNSQARSTARKAAELRPGWGKPYALIGDIYAKAARSCGDDWNQRLAVIAAIEKWQLAKSKDLDDTTAGSVSGKIGKYLANHLPEKSEGFMRGVKPGQSAKCGCWIGETVKVRFKG